MKNIRKEIIALLIATSAIISTSSCGKKENCTIESPHAHKYINDEGYITYMNKEYVTHKGYNRSDDYIYINSNEKELLEFLNKNNILKISDNIEKIKEIQDEYKKYEHNEYEYRYNYHTYIYTGKVMVPVNHVGHSWTLNKNGYRLTGKTRNCEYLFYGVKIEKDEKGKYVIIPSKYTTDVTSIMDEYPYIKEDFIVVYDNEKGIVYNDSTKNLNELRKLKEEYPESFEENIKRLNLK